MEIRVKRATASGDKTTSTIEIDLVAPASVRRAINEEVGQYLLEQTQVAMSRSESPVDGESFDALSPAYKKKKVAMGGSGNPDLEFSGAMRDALDVEATADSIEIGVWGAVNAGKADGHNNFSGDSPIPKRRFLPDKGQDYSSEIVAEVERIVADHLLSAVVVEKADLEDVDTKAELYKVLEEAYGEELSRAELREAVMRSEQLTLLLDDMDLLQLL